jgi:predicted PurR-regulated permease PerM
VATLSKSLHAAEQDVRNISGPLIALGAVVAILYFGRVFFITSLAAVMLAFILEPFVTLLVRIRFPRALASFVVCAAALSMLYLMGMGAYSQLAGLTEELPQYGQRIGDLVEIVSQKVEGLEQRTYLSLIPAPKQPLPAPEPPRKKRRTAEAVVPAVPGTIPEVRIHADSSPIKDFISVRLGSFYQIMLMASFVPFLVYFMLSWHDHIYRSFLQFFQGEDRAAAARSLQGIADMVRAFVVGNSVLGLLLASASSLAFWIVRLPYPLLVGPLSRLPHLFGLSAGGGDCQRFPYTGAEPFVSQDCGIARASESAGGDVLADDLGISVGRAGVTAGDSYDGGVQGRVRQREGTAADGEVLGRLSATLVAQALACRCRLQPTVLRRPRQRRRIRTWLHFRQRREQRRTGR